MRFQYKEQFRQTEDVKLLIVDERGTQNYIIMQYQNEKHSWYCETDKRVVRYKFMIGQIMRLNDPTAGKYIWDKNGEIWSVPSIILQKEKSNISVEQYMITNMRTSTVSHMRKKAEFIYGNPFSLYFGIHLTRVSGIHSVTYICYQPDGRVYYLEEKAVHVRDSICDVDVIFESRIEGIPPDYAIGVWQMQAFLDGKSVLRDYFVLRENIQSEFRVIDYRG